MNKFENNTFEFPMTFTIFDGNKAFFILKSTEKEAVDKERRRKGTN